MTVRKSLLEGLSKDWAAKALSLVAAILLFFLNRMGSLDTQSLSVPLEVRGVGDLLPRDPYDTQVKLTLRGDRDELDLIKPGEIVAWVDLSEAKGEGIQRMPIQFERLGAAFSANPLEIRSDPKQIQFNLERRETRSVAVEPFFKGIPAMGYEKVEHQVLPPTLAITGPRSLVSELTRLETEPMDLSGLNADAAVRIRVRRPNPLLAFPGADSVEVKVSVREALAQKSFDLVDIELRGLHPGLAVEGELPKGSLRIQGSQEAVRRIASAEGFLTVDCSGVSVPGTHTMNVRLDAPEGLVVVGYDPQTVRITFLSEASR